MSSSQDRNLPSPQGHTARWLVPLLLLAVVLPLFLAFRSASLDDFDSYSFALALDQFSLDLHQPQPPGFPIYIFLGRVFRALVGTPRAALTLLSALSGAACALLLYELGRATASGAALAGVGAALLVSLSPMGWLTAEKALSDMPGLALTLLPLWLLWRGQESPRWLALGALVSGLGMGLRPQNGLPVLLLLAGLTVAGMLRRRSLIPAIWTGAPFLFGVLIWLLPTLNAAGGLRAYLAHLNAHSAHVRQTDSLLATGLPFARALRPRAFDFTHTFLLHTIGVGLSTPWGWAEAMRGLAAAAVVIPGVVMAGWRRRETWILAIWTALVGAQTFFLVTLDRPRLMLPLLPPLALLIARGWARIRVRFLPEAALTTAAFLLLLQGVPLAATLASVPTPAARATSHIAAHYPPEETLVAAAGSFRSAQMELPGYQLIYLYQFDPEAARDLVDSDEVRYVTILDRDKFPTEALSALSADGRYVPLEDLTFTRDPRAHTQSDQVRLQILTPADALPPEALALPSDGCIDIGGSEDGRYLDQGWYRPEGIGGARGRWAGGTLTSTVRIYLPPEENLRLTVRALPYPDAQELTLRIAGQELGQFALQPSWAEYTAPLPEDVLSQTDVILLELIHARSLSPAAETDGASSDTRTLTAAYDWICLSREDSP